VKNFNVFPFDQYIFSFKVVNVRGEWWFERRISILYWYFAVKDIDIGLAGFISW